MPEVVIETMATDIFDLEKIEDIEKYFKNKYRIIDFATG